MSYHKYQKGCMFMGSQEQEIKTIRERTIKLELSDADVERLCTRAGSVNLTVSQLLEYFIGDLVDGTYSNGSDERMYANQWFDRCGFGMFSDNTFLRYLIEYGSVDEVVGLWNGINEIKEDLEYAKHHTGEYEPDDIEEWKEDLEEWQASINVTFDEYKKSTKDEVGTLEEEMKTVIKWYEGMQQMKNANATINIEEDDETVDDMEL